MALMLLYDRYRSEVDLLREVIGKIGDLCDELELECIQSMNDLEKTIALIPEVSLLCADFELNGETAIKKVKQKDPVVSVVVIANSTTSPLLYVRPEIMPSGLLLRPLTFTQTLKVLSEVLEVVLRKEREKLFGSETFSFTTREGTTRVPFSQILYFEARNKKIVLCTERLEMEFYSTLENLQVTIPDYFIRCHKGYLVNSHLVFRVDLGNNYIQLVGGLKVPISRSYRSCVKETLA